MSLSEVKFAGHLKLDGSMTMRRTLPDEEVFESLAARVRPLLLKSESVHHLKVCNAIQANIDSTEIDVPEDLLNQFAALRRRWSQIDLDGTNVLRFAMQSAKSDGSETTPQVSDTQLASAWLYSDLVHVDARGSKSEGLLFPVKERYSAAVTYFALAAMLSLMTLDLVMALHELGVIDLDDHALKDDVIVGVQELVDESVAYVGPVGSPMPSLDIGVQALPEGFRSFTVAELLRQTPANQVQVVLTGDDRSIVGEYEAAVSRRVEKEGRVHWETLVAGVVSIEVSFAVHGDDQVTNGQLEDITSHAGTNRLKLAEAMLCREIASSREMTFYVNGQQFFALDVTSHATADLTDIDVSIDTLYDLVTIENITHQALKPLSGHYTRADRALLRRTRLLWEGEVVAFRTSPLPVTAPQGVVPKVIAMPATTHSIADTEVPLPATCIRHPLMRPESVTQIPDSDPPLDRMHMVVPLSGEPFLAWAPDRRSLGDDEELREPTSLGLSHFDADE